MSNSSDSSDSILFFIRQRFTEFLRKKGYPSAALSSTDIDLDKAEAYYIKDTATENDLGVVCLISLKEVTDIEAFEKALAFHLIFEPQLPIYVILPSKEEFAIAKWSKNALQNVAPEKFPSYAKLKESAYELSFPESERKLAEIIDEDNKNRKARLWVTGASVAVGLLIGIIGIMRQSEEKTRERYLDQIQHEMYAQQKLLDSIKALTIRTIPHLPDSVEVFYDKVTTERIEKRITILEDGLLQNPEKVLQYHRLNNEVEKIQEKISNHAAITQVKLDALDSKVGTNNSWTIGLVAAVVISILGNFYINFRNGLFRSARAVQSKSDL